MTAKNQKPLLFAHIGDLHITNAKEQNYKDFLSIIAQIAAEFGDKLDFVVLPGDNADNGLAEQYKLIAPALRMLKIPAYILTGDHDMEQGNLENFYASLPARKLPFGERIKGINCLFLDVCGHGSGGPDFRFGKQQLESFEKMLNDGKKDGGEIAVFMHTYPADLADSTEKRQLLQLIEDHHVLLVDMGHTHYNEIANNGKTVYTATRSTGQIAEGPVGYSVTSIDNGCISWRFKALDDPFPFVMITQPADRRLAITKNNADSKNAEIRASVFSSVKVKSVSCQLDEGNIQTMTYDPERNDWYAPVDAPAKATYKFTVEALDMDGRPGQHTIEVATQLFKKTFSGRDGTDEHAIGAWPENGILGTQLGPNRNAKPAAKPKK